MIATPLSIKVISAVPVCDNQEELVDLREMSSKLLFSTAITNSFLAREGTAARLISACQTLPVGLTFRIYEAFRPLAEQERLYVEIWNKCRLENPKWQDCDIEREVDKWVANPRLLIPPHCTGGAIDLTLSTTDGEELDMGTTVNCLSPDSWTLSKEIGKEAGKNRQTLIVSLEDAGFVNYPLEWWHWSYGDQHWGAVQDRPALYAAR